MAKRKEAEKIAGECSIFSDMFIGCVKPEKSTMILVGSKMAKCISGHIFNAKGTPEGDPFKDLLIKK